jgi:capsular polysaccharide transport system permease protein
MSHALSIQRRVLWALCLREIRGKHGKSKLGYLWQIIKSGFAVGVFWWIREMGNFVAPYGLPTPIFLFAGFIPWFIFSETLSMVMEAVKTNATLLTFPQITPLDLCLSSAIVVWCTEVVILLLYMTGLLLAGYDFYVYDLVILIIALVGIWLLSLGVGLFLGALALHFETLEKLVPMVMRVIFFVSGMFFSVSQLPSRYAEILWWNPILNFIELLRGSFISTHVQGEIKISYIFVITFVFLVLGLLLERTSRALQGR